MSLLQTLSDLNVQKFIAPLIGGLLGVLLSWVGNQLPPLKNANQPWRIIRLAIEIAISIVVINSWEDAVGAIAGSDTTAQAAKIAYFGVVFLLGCAIANDFWRLVCNPSPTREANREATRKRNLRQALMDNVRHKWIYSVLENPNSLYHRSRIELGLQERPDLVRRLQSRRREESWRTLPPNTRIFDEFVKLGEGCTLLIVGEPGSGKTTLLLELARDLLDVADAADPEQSVPVVLNLSSWGTFRRDRQPIKTLKDWLVEELYVQYSVRREVGEALLKEESLTLLLDGLDEVRQEWRDECTAAINQFQQDHGTTEIVVCSRIAEYEGLSQGLTRFREAVYVLPLDLPQVDAFLQQAGAPLDKFRAAVRQDEELRRLVSKPLFLAVASLAYMGRSADDLLGLSEKERSGILFDRYIEQMFEQRPMEEQQRQQMVDRLSLVAQKMGSEKEFLIERMQPGDWLDESTHRWQYKLTVGLIFGLIFGLIGRLIIGLIGLPLAWLYPALVAGLIAGLGAGLIFFGSVDSMSIILFEAPQISISREVRQKALRILKPSLILVLIFGPSFWLIFGLMGRVDAWSNGGRVSSELSFMLDVLLNVYLNGLLSILLSFGLVIDVLSADIQNRTYPNQGIWDTRNNMFLGGITSLIFALLLHALLSFTLPLLLGQATTIRVVPAIIPPLLIGTLLCGGIACIQHFALRVVLHHAKLIPWNFVSFFQQAEDRLFVQRTGGSYIFIHRYLQEHFASLGQGAKG